MTEPGIQARINLSEISDRVIDGCRGEWHKDITSHDLLSHKIEREFLADTDFKENDLKEFISARSGSIHEGDESIILGFYSGCLLHLLTERNRKKGQKTIFYVNGQGKRFDYLFYHAREVDEVIVDNFVGDYICGEVGRSGSSGVYGIKSKSNLVMVVNCKGEYIAESVGRGDNSYIDSVTVANNVGGFAAEYVGSSHGRVGSVIVSNNKGNFAAYNVGDCGGEVGYVIVINNKGDDAASEVASTGGKCDLVMIVNNEGKHAARSIGHWGCFGDPKGWVNQVIIANARGIDTALGVHAKRLVLHNVDGFRGVSDEGSVGIHGHVDELIQEERELEKYQRFIRLANSMKDITDYRDILAVAAGIDSVYQHPG